eukprot:TRINITY_DN7276_c0_g4_i1.p1 TRINITY_DN7276_c0_g4~~TRINITY_DN7276_c0_g4_i1.p1  ORF type:complete len:116 (+),score=22.60 TRINITY_DN7276_c0_g4_i1:154-501(+)
MERKARRLDGKDTVSLIKTVLGKLSENLPPSPSLPPNYRDEKQQLWTFSIFLPFLKKENLDTKERRNERKKQYKNKKNLKKKKRKRLTTNFSASFLSPPILFSPLFCEFAKKKKK